MSVVSLKRVAAAAMLQAVVWSAAAAQQVQESAWKGWTVYWENDSFVHFATGTDELYTNGIRFSVGRNPDRNWKFVDKLGPWWQNHAWTAKRSQELDPTTAVVLGQNFFTPREITTYTADPTDRPYAGLLYTGLHIDLTEHDKRTSAHFPDLRVQHSFEGVLGVFGQTAFGGEVQSAVHVLRQNRIPKGWPNQVQNELAAYVAHTWRARTNWKLFNLVPHAGVMLGTPQTYVYAGGTAMLGFNLDGFPGVLLQANAAPVPGAKKHALAGGLVAGFEARGFARNDVVEGSTRRNSPGLASKDGVVDQRYGLMFRFAEWRLDYAFLVRRSAEVESEGELGTLKHNYGSLSITYDPTQSLGGPGVVKGAYDVVRHQALGWFFRDFYFDASMGSGHVNLKDTAATDGPAMHVALGRGMLKRSGLLQHVGLGFELNGLVRQGHEPTSTSVDHTDQFFTNMAVVARLTPFPRHRHLESLNARIGFGSASSRLQYTPGVLGPRTQPCPANTELDPGPSSRTCNVKETGSGMVLGASYGLHFGKSREAVFLSDVSLNKLNLSQKADVVMWSFGIGWRPGHIRP